MTPRSKRLMAMGALLAACVSTAGCQSGSDKAGAATPSLTVEVTTPTLLDWPRQVAASGAFKPWQEAVISAETGPLRIASINADIGSRVRRGAVLATLVRESLGADRARLIAEVAEAQANVFKADSDMARAREVGSSGALSAQQVQQYRVAQMTAKASLDSARAQLRSVDIQLGQTRIVAVDDGIISSRSALLGAVVNAGTELFRMVRRGRIEWQAELDSNQLIQVTAGDTAQLTLPNGQSIVGRVRLVSPTLSGMTSRGIAYVQLPSRPDVRAGIYASGTINVGMIRTLTLPDTAVVLRDGRSYVYILQNNMRVKEQQVTTGQRRDGRVAVSGVPVGTRVVASGGAFLSDGVTVKLSESPSGAAK